MNFIEAIEPHNDRLDTYQKLKTFGGDSSEMDKLIEIFNKYVKNPKGDMVANPACSSCMRKMMQRLVTHRELQRVSNVKTINKVIKEPIKLSPVDNKINSNTLKWGEFKTYCKELGINTKGKKRAQLNEELKNL